MKNKIYILKYISFQNTCDMVFDIDMTPELIIISVYELIFSLYYFKCTDKSKQIL